MDLDLEYPATPELHTELGSHLHPRRPLSRTPTRKPPVHVQTETPIAAPPQQVTKLIEDDDMLIDDPWAHKSRAYEHLPFGRPVSAVQLFTPKKVPLPPNRIASIFSAEFERREKERKALERGPPRPARIIPTGSAVRTPTMEWMKKVAMAMHTPQRTVVAKSLSGDNLCQEDIATCVKPLAWLNDEIINSYMTVLIQYLRLSTGNMAQNERPRFHAFNSFFYSTLRDKGYQGVRRWANRARIGGEGLLDVDTVFVPVHQSSHWTLLVVRPVDRTVEYFDSLGQRGKRQYEVIKDWLRGELGSKFDEEEWSLLPSMSSYQDNGSDCGVFLLMNAKAVALGIEPRAFGANDTTLLRQKIVAELMNSGLHGDFDPRDTLGVTLL